MALKIVKSFALDFARTSPLEYIFVKTRDKNSRVLDITPLNNGLPYDIPANAKAIFSAKKPDKTEILNNAVINTETGHIEITLSEQTLAVDGVIVCDISLYTPDETFISSQHFYMKAYPFAANDAESSNEYGTLVVALLAVDEKIRQAEELFNNNQNTVPDSVILSTPQTLTKEQQEQTRNNINASVKTLEVTLSNFVDVESTDTTVTLRDAVSSHSFSEILNHINNGGTAVVKSVADDGDVTIYPYSYSNFDKAIFAKTLYYSVTDAVMTHKNVYFITIAISEEKTARIATSKLTSGYVENSVTEDRVNKLIADALGSLSIAEDIIV